MARRRRHHNVMTGGTYYFPSGTLPRHQEIIPDGIENARWLRTSSDTVRPWYPRERFGETRTTRGFSFGASPQASVYRRRLGVSPQAAAVWRLAMRAPSRVKFCVARKQRRQVLFALDRAGYSGSTTKRHYYRGAESSYRC